MDSLERTKKTKRKRRAEQGTYALIRTLPESDQVPLKRTLRKFTVFFFGIFAIIILAVGIAVPLVQQTSHTNSVNSTLTEILGRVIGLVEEDGESSADTEAVQGFPYFICSVDSSALDDGSIDSEEISWLYGESEYSSYVEEHYSVIFRVFSGDVTSSGNYMFMIREGNDGTIYLVGTDESDYQSSMRAGVITLEALLVLSFIALCILSAAIILRIFRPVVNTVIEQKKFVGDASHELKTPLAVIKADTELLMNSPGTTDSQKKWLVSIEKQANDMSNTIANLVELSSINSSFHIDKDEDVSALINECCLAIDAICFEKGIYYESHDIQAGIRVKCNADEVKKLVEELLNNAVKYSESKDGNPPYIAVSFHMVGLKAELAIENTGCTIDESEKERIFDRFYRTDTTRSGQAEGSGLGLYLCRSICEKNKFTISCEPEKGVKTTFRVVMPLD